MTTAEKAHAYDEAIERVKKLQETCDSTAVVGWCEYIFPELKESEDERIRKAIFNYLTKMWGNSQDDVCGVHVEDAIAWLEKQDKKILANSCKSCKDEQNPFDYENANIQQKDFAPKADMPRYSIGDVLCDKSCTTLSKESKSNFEITDIRNGMYICDKCSFPISQQDEYELVAKRIEQKPTDKVEPKFHEGEWVVYNNDICQIVKREEGCNKLVTNFGIEKELVNERNLSTARLWTIQDAKDGDVLISKYGSMCIFKDNKSCYCYIDTEHENFYAKNNRWFSTDYTLKPATKEQRDLLFQKMEEAGYEWDSNKKELSCYMA